ncbi:MAG: hypothetical protein AAGJ35_04290, partial [Myxococcota bacterium]
RRIPRRICSRRRVCRTVSKSASRTCRYVRGRRICRTRRRRRRLCSNRRVCRTLSRRVCRPMRRCRRICRTYR